MAGMRLYNQGQWKLKLKDLKTSKDETQVEVYVGEMGTREGIELGWSWGFGLDELGVWQECWRWVPHMELKVQKGKSLQALL